MPHRILPVLFVLFSCVAARAAEIPEFPPPQPEHQWLQQFVGEWDMKSQASMGAGQPPMTCEGHETVRSLGGFWIVSEIHNNANGTPMQAHLTVGYNPQTKKYSGTWQDSMTSHLWVYTGSVDPTGKILTLEAEGPNFMGGGEMVKFRDITEFKSPDHRVTKSEMQGKDGQWVTFMTGEAKRSAVASKP